MSAPILLDGHWQPATAPTGTFRATNPSTKAEIAGREFPISSWTDLAALLAAGQRAARAMATLPPEVIADFLDRYAALIDARASTLAQVAHEETGLAIEPRLLKVELPRTSNQLRQAATAVRDGSWAQATIDTATKIRSIHRPLGGAVLVFGPNNFPFAYNGIAGGDFAAAIAAGNPVIGKAHPAHPHTTELLAQAALEAAQAAGLPNGAVQLFYHTSNELGLQLAAHQQLGAIGFTGSRPAGLALKAASDRVGKPIYLEMSSVNPVFILDGAQRERAAAIAGELHQSITLGQGQFCTKPGIAVVAPSAQRSAFVAELQQLMQGTTPGVLLTGHQPKLLAEIVAKQTGAGADVLAGGAAPNTSGFAFQPTLLRVSGRQFLQHADALQSEAFGPVSLVVEAESAEQVPQIAAVMEGNLTGSIYSDTQGADDAAYATLEPVLRAKVGRLLNDKMPTGVAVVPSMNHGGPFPATGHPGFTAVGIPASIIRFSALHSYDNVRMERLPLALRDKNPTGTMRRLIDGEWTTRDV